MSIDVWCIYGQQRGETLRVRRTDNNSATNSRTQRTDRDISKRFPKNGIHEGQQKPIFYVWQPAFAHNCINLYLCFFLCCRATSSKRIFPGLQWSNFIVKYWGPARRLCEVNGDISRPRYLSCARMRSQLHASALSWNILQMKALSLPRIAVHHAPSPVRHDRVTR